LADNHYKRVLEFTSYLRTLDPFSNNRKRANGYAADVAAYKLFISMGKTG
jgi:hypothetical protein